MSQDTLNSLWTIADQNLIKLGIKMQLARDHFTISKDESDQFITQDLQQKAQLIRPNVVKGVFCLTRPKVQCYMFSINYIDYIIDLKAFTGGNLLPKQINSNGRLQFSLAGCAGGCAFLQFIDQSFQVSNSNLELLTYELAQSFRFQQCYQESSQHGNSLD